MESGVRSVEEQLNAGASETHLSAPGPDAARLSESAPLPSEPGGELADAAPAEPPRQPSLPGFDRI